MRIVLATMMMLVALATPALADKVTLTGDVTYRERIALPPGGSLTVSLVDLATPARARVSARALLSGTGQVPLTFTLNFEDSIVLPGHSYAIEAEISGPGGASWFRTAEPYPVDPLAPAGPIEIILGRVVQQESAPEEAPVQPRPAAEASILNVTWQARTIAGRPVIRGVVSSLSIASDRRAGGRGGCNSWFAQAEVGDGRLVFSAIAATQMACLSDDATSQENSFFAALGATRFWRLSGDQLMLVDDAGTELAILERSPF